MRLKHALRSLAGSPAFTLGSILCLSVGLALTIAAYSLINAVLFRSMPGIHNQQQLRHIWTGIRGQFPEIVPSSAEEYEIYRASLADVASVAAGVEARVAALGEGSPVATRAVFASPNYFAVLGTVPVAGHLLDGSEEDGAVISERLWHSQFGGRPDIVGRLLQVNGRPFRVTGVTPAKFVGAQTGEFDDDAANTPAVWLPLSTHRVTTGVSPTRPAHIKMTARLAAGTSETALALRAEALAASLAATTGRTGSFVRVRPIHRGPYDDTSDLAIGLSVIMAIPLGILAIACANVANLLLARGTARSREVAVRMALGASRGSVVRQLLLESLLVALAAAVVAMLLCEAALRLVEQWMPIPVAVDWRVALFATLAAATTALAFGLWPAVTTARATVTTRLQDARPLRARTRRLLVGLQLALSTALLVVAALLIRTVSHVSTPARDDEDRTLTATFGVGLAGYDRARLDEFQRGLLERVESVPDVEAAGFAPSAPFRTGGEMLLTLPGESKNQRLAIAGGHITGEWLRAAGLSILAGRGFVPADRQGVPTVAVVNEALAARLWPTGSGLGRSVTISPIEERQGPSYEVQVIGVVSNATKHPEARRPAMSFYLPVAVASEPQRTLWIRTRGDAAGFAEVVRAAATELAPRVPLTDLATVASARVRETGPFELLARTMTALGSLALSLAAFGMFSLLTYLVGQRRREIGVRLALGARPRDIVRLIVGESATVAVAGAIVGGAAAAIVASGLDGLIVGVGPADPLSFATASGVLVVTALAASAHPALRATRTDPASVLRAE